MSHAKQSEVEESDSIYSVFFPDQWGDLAAGVGFRSGISDLNQYVITCNALHRVIDRPEILIVDLRPSAHGAEGYIPGSVHLDYERLIRRHGRSEGLLPDVTALRDLFSELGLEPWHCVVAYDDETGVEASRLLWTLEVAGHRNYALLDGGFAAWESSNLPISQNKRIPSASEHPEIVLGDAVVNKQEVLEAVGRKDVCIVDTRTLEEYLGNDVRAQRGGHLPGAIHFDWTSAIDLYGTGKLRSPDQLQVELDNLGVRKDKEIILYCQSNRRCAHTFIVFKWLGYENVRSYHGSWSEWGNDPDTPISH